MNDDIKEILDKLEIVARKHTIEVCDDGSKIETMPASIVEELRLNNWSAKLLLDYITNLQQKYDKALEDSVKESHKRMELENTLHKIMVSDGEKTTPVLDLIKENERLKELVNPKTQIFIDTQDMEERYGEELYEEYLEKQVKDYKSRVEKAVEYLKSKEDSLFMTFSDDVLDHDELIDKKIGTTLLNILNGSDE